MTAEEKAFFRQIVDRLRTFWCQREALFQICGSELENWEPVYRIAAGEPEIVRRADELFAPIYASIDSGELDLELLRPVQQDDLKQKPN